jgi:transposase-like protein
MKREQATTEETIRTTSWSTLEAYAREQIQSWLQGMLEEEITELVGRDRYERRDGVDVACGYRNGFGKPRRLSMSCGTITVRRPRVRGLDERFESRILPLFKRRTEEVGDLLPQLYLHGLAQRDFELALRGLLGDGAPLSPASIARLTERWHEEYQTWKKAPIEGEVVYLWADGIYVKAGFEKEKAAVLVIVAAFTDGTKHVIAVESGYRESKASWLAVLRELIRRGMNVPRMVVADGALGLWAAIAELGWECEEQRCWNHKITNVLDAISKKEQPRASELLKKIPYADTREGAEILRDDFVKRFRERFPKACERLLDDWKRMVSFYAFPEKHWKHLRTSNVVESPFASVRLRTSAAKRYKKTANAEAILWKLLMVAEKNFRKLNSPELLPSVAAGDIYVNGVLNKRSRTRAA